MTLRFVLAALAILASPPLRAEDECLVCHASLGDKPSVLFRGDVHRKAGVTCAGCHGGNAGTADMEVAMSPAAGFTGVPRGDDVSRRCARCHDDSAAMARSRARFPAGQPAGVAASVHARMSTTGKERILQCTTCHGAHGILRVDDPAAPVHPLKIGATCARCHSDAAYMRSYNPSLPVDQLEKYRTSVHGTRNARGDARTAQCASCHGAHEIRPSKDVKSSVYRTNIPGTCGRCHSDRDYMKPYGIPTRQQEDFAGSVHGVALLQKGDAGAPACNSCHGNHAATPPGVESVSKVCGTCHALNADLFSGSPHKKAFDERRLPECETCHGNHAIVTATNALLGASPEAVCSRCHTSGQNAAGYRAAAAMRSLIDSLEGGEQRARAGVEEAEQKGMEVEETKFRLRDVRQARLQARTVVHGFDEGRFRETVGKGLATAALISAEARAAVDEYYFRRTGLGISTLIISVVALSLFLYIRRLERGRAGHPPPPGGAGR